VAVSVNREGQNVFVTTPVPNVGNLAGPWTPKVKPRRQTRGSSRKLDGSNETGAVLVLALVYIISISLIVGALADWAMNSLNNTTTFRSVSQLHYAISGVTNSAIHDVRYNPIPEFPTSTDYSGVPTTLSPCWGSGPTSQLTINNVSVAVWCTTVIDLTQPNTRTVTFYSCPSTLIGSQCQLNPTLTAVVAFDDYPAGGGALLTVQCNLSSLQCGEGQTLEKWQWT